MTQLIKASRFAVLLLVLWSLSACVAWLAPQVKTELVELRPGQYQLDKTHARLLFKIQHLGLSTYVGLSLIHI